MRTDGLDGVQLLRSLRQVRPLLFAFAAAASVIVGGWVLTMAAGLSVLAYSNATLLEDIRTCASSAVPVPFLLPTWRLWRLAFAFHRSAREFDLPRLDTALRAHYLFWRATAIASAAAVLLFTLSWSLLRVAA